MVTMATRSGPQMLQDFDRQLERAERQSAAAQEETERVARRGEELRQDEAAALRELARLRMLALGKGGAAAVAELEGASRRVRALLDERGREAAAAEAQVSELRAAVAEAAARRDAESARLAEAEAQARAAFDAARGRLAHDAQWQRLRAAAADCVRVAGHAQEKAALARNDRAVKGKPYLDDPLFAYLWRRGFGTAAYRGGGIVRALDGWVARVARYEPARRAFALLDELPRRLADHAERMGEEAQARAAELAAFERAGGAAAEPPARAAYDAAEAALHAAHHALAKAEQRRGALAAGEDKLSGEASALLEQALAQESLRDLREAASRTPTPEDDAIVARLFAARRERAGLDRQLTIRRLEAKAARERVEELMRLRQGLRERDVGRSAWSLDGALLGVLVGQVLGGAMSRDGFWGRMEQHRMPGPWGPPADSPWGGGAGGGPWGGGAGGGDFQTGGGFGGGSGNAGGGDFRSGGAF